MRGLLSKETFPARRYRLVQAARYALLAYGIFMIVGGILGYVLPKTPSKISLIAGCISGLLALVAFFVSSLESWTTPGLAVGLVVSAGIAVMMLPRIKKAKKPQSTILIVALSAVTAVVVALGLALGN